MFRNKLKIDVHHITLTVICVAILYFMITTMRWDWLPQYYPAILSGIWQTIWLLFFSVLFGFILAVPIGLVQVIGPKPLGLLAAGFCTLIRGTPRLLQIFFLYYGLGSVFPYFPEIRESFLWPYLREAWPYALVSLTISFAAYEGEIMRGAFAGVPKGELEAARSFGMTRYKMVRRIWLPRAVQRVLPTLTGEVILQLKSTPLVATITIFDAYGVISRIRSDTYLTYEPLLLLALIYLILAGIVILIFKYIENKLAQKRE